jgi:tetratricopeptide (TPR) repeat protein
LNSNDAETGIQLANTYRYEDALPYLERAHRDAPTNLPVLHTLANALQLSGRAGQAIEHFRQAASRMPGNPEVLLGLARAHWLIGEDGEGLKWLETALDLDPRIADAGGLLDWLLKDVASDAELVCDILECAMARNPGRADLLQHYAVASLASEHLDAAADAFRRYSSLQPDDPGTHVELARLAVIRGDFDEARRHVDAAFALDPDFPAAIWEQLQIDGGPLDEATLAKVQRLLQFERNPSKVLILHNLLARHHDRKREYAMSASYIAKANALQTNLLPAEKRYNPERVETDTNLTIADLTPATIESLRSAGNPDARPLFIIGMPRSGTTLLSEMLASHPSIVSVGEQTIAIKSFWRVLINGKSATLTGIPADVVREASDWHLRKLEDRVRRLSLRADAERIVDKLPGNYMYAGWIHVAFPNATIIHCVRDPRDVALSCWRTHFTNILWGLDLEHITHRFEQHRRIMRHWRATIGDRMVEVRHERLVADPEAEIRRVLAATGLDWHPDVLAFAERKGYVRTASQFQVRQPLNTRGIGQWRNYEETLRPFLPRLNALAAQDDIEIGASDAG